MKVHPLNGICDVGLGGCQVLESANEAPVGRRVGDRGPVVLKEFHLGVDMCGVGFTVGHVSLLQNVEDILALVKEEALGLTLHVDLEEVVERA